MPTPSFRQLAVDTGVSVASEEAERAIGAYAISRIPIASFHWPAASWERPFPD